ncbi:MAG: carboxypeptidase-like regulatory domain-containing protein, partial [Sphingobacteriales bacterium]|nr:carboxypeptidase-like regulatory domain-containing protein [Sphingobacteriales bacterium]
MKKIYLMMMLLTVTSYSIAQDVIKVIGKVVSKDGKNLSKATVSIVNLQTKDSTKVTTDDEGTFKVSLSNQSYNFLITYIGYDFILKKIDLTAQVGEFNMGNVEMNPGSNLMSNITLESQKVQIKEDTVAYLVDSTMYRKNDNVEALLKNMPGIQVDKDGKVTAQGKQVTKVKVNGKEFFNGDVTTATRELNADMVEKIQIIDDYGDQAAFTGIKDGDPTKTMNIQLRKDKNKGYFGSIEGGYGTASRYIGKFSVNKFNNNQQISVFGNMNNTNASL